MIAARAGRCVDCDGSISPGAPIKATADGWAHEDCPTSRVRFICNECHLACPCPCDDDQ